MSLQVLHVVATLRTGNECWEGNGFWEVPETVGNWAQITSDVLDAIWEGVPALCFVNAILRLNVNGEVYEVKGLLAEQLQQRFGRLPSNSGERFIWEPVINVRFVLGGEHGK